MVNAEVGESYPRSRKNCWLARVREWVRNNKCIMPFIGAWRDSEGECLPRVPQEGLRDPWQTALELQAYTGGGEADTILTRFGHGGVTGLGVGNLQITAQKHANAVAEPAFRALSFRGCGRAWRA